MAHAQPQNRNNNAVNDARRTATMAGRNVTDIPQLLMVKVDQEQVDNEAQCTTCLETFNLNEKVAKLKCQHIFHRACIQPWLQRNKTCPVCRAEVELRRDMGVVKMERRDLRAVNMQRRDMGVVHRERRDMGAVNMQRRDLEDVDIDAVSELLHHTIENVPIINAAARGIAGIVQAVDNGNEQIRQAVERVEDMNMNRRAIANVEMAGRVIDNLASLFTGVWF